jgi:hypothetical protein
MKNLLVFVMAIMFACLNIMAQSDHEPGYQTHDRFFLSMSLGPAWMSINDDITDGPYNNMKMKGIGGIVDFKAGYALNESLILHGDVISISSGSIDITVDGTDMGTIEGDNSVGMIMVGGGLTNYFIPENFFISGTVGMGSFNITSGDNTSSTERGLGLLLKAGKEWWISSRWALGMSASFNYTHVNNNADGMQENLSGMALGISFNATFN